MVVYCSKMIFEISFGVEIYAQASSENHKITLSNLPFWHQIFIKIYCFLPTRLPNMIFHIFLDFCPMLGFLLDPIGPKNGTKIADCILLKSLDDWLELLGPTGKVGTLAGALASINTPIWLNVCRCSGDKDIA